MRRGTLIDDLMAIVEARLQANPPSEQEWKTFLDDGLPDEKEHDNA